MKWIITNDEPWTECPAGSAEWFPWVLEDSLPHTLLQGGICGCKHVIWRAENIHHCFLKLRSNRLHILATSSWLQQKGANFPPAPQTLQNLPTSSTQSCFSHSSAGGVNHSQVPPASSPCEAPTSQHTLLTLGLCSCVRLSRSGVPSLVSAVKWNSTSVPEPSGMSGITVFPTSPLTRSSKWHNHII